MPNPYFDLSVIARAPKSNSYNLRTFTNDHSAVAAAAYIGRSVIYDQRQGCWHDYRRAPGPAVHEEVLLPAGAPAQFAKPHVLWNAAEQMEKRKDAQLARRLIIGLPHELSRDDQTELLRRFLADSFVSRGMIAHFAIHTPGEEQDQRHWHAHVLLTLRRVNRTGFWSHKQRDWNHHALTVQWRNDWAEAQNAMFRRKGLDLTIEPRTLKPTRLLPTDVLQQRIAAERTPETPIGKHHWLTGTGPDQALRDTRTENLQRLDDAALALRHLKAAIRACDGDLDLGNVRSLSGMSLERLLRDPGSPHTSAILDTLQRLDVKRHLERDSAKEKLVAQPARFPEHLWRTPPSISQVSRPTLATNVLATPPLRTMDFSSLVPIVTAFDIGKAFGIIQDNRSFLEQIQQAMDYAQLLADLEATRHYKLRRRLEQRRQRNQDKTTKAVHASRKRVLRLVKRAAHNHS